MRQAVKRVSRPIMWALMTAFAVTLYPHCVTGTEMTAAEKLCCVTMGSDCGHRAQEKICCSTERLDQATVAKATTIPAPDASGVPLAVFAEIPPQPLVGYHFDRFTPKPLGIPKYLLVSTLLI